MIHADLARLYGFTPDAPIDATHALPPVRPAAEREAERTLPIYPDPGPDLTAVRHTRWPGQPAPEQVPAAAVWEQAAAVLRRLDVVEAKLDELLAAVRGAPR